MATDLSVAVRTFKDRYKYFPGDLPDAQNKIPEVQNDCNYNRDNDANTPPVVGNGLIDTKEVIANGLSEVECLPIHLSRAGLIRGSDPTQPSTPMRSRFGVVRILSRIDFATEPLAPNLPDHLRNVIVFEDLPVDVAQEMDRNMDDGNTTTGQHRSSPITNPSQGPVKFYVVPL